MGAGIKDFKDIKDLKEKEKEKEFKEIKEKDKELKEKDKELKEKDKELKEVKEKEFKEVKEKDIKEKDKDIVEQPGAAMPPGGPIVEMLKRIERIEKHLHVGEAFIEGSERPDVDAGALDEDGQ